MFAAQLNICVVMKKKTFIICAGALFMALITGSCSKECDCILYEDGVEIGSSTETVWGQTCEEFSSAVDSPYGKMGLECTKKK